MRSEDCMKKIVLTAAPNMEREEVIEDLEKENVTIRKCIPLRIKTDIRYSYLIAVLMDT